MKKGCELCGLPARMYCESDEASLCWDCDEKVHSANFLVAKHSRNLLCHICQAPTPWNASGPKLGPAVSVCDTCVRNCKAELQASQGTNEDEHDDDDVEYEDEDNDYTTEDDGEYSGDHSDDDEEEDDDVENQVVPWSSTPLPPPAPSSEEEEASSSRISISGSGLPVLKRIREMADLDSQMQDDGCSSLRFHPDIAATAIMSYGASEELVDEATSLRSFRPFKVANNKRDDSITGNHSSSGWW